MPLNRPLLDLLRQVDPAASVVSEFTPGSWYAPPGQAGYSRKGAQYVNCSSWGESYRLCCPFCDDHHGHLYFSHLAGATVRVKGRKTPIRFSPTICCCHRRACHREDPRFREWLDGLQLWKLPELDLTEKGIQEASAQYGLCSDIEDQLPQPCYPLLSSETPGWVRDHIWGRRYDPAWLQSKFGVGYCPQHATYENRNDKVNPKRFFRQDRLIIPIIQGLSLVGWQARMLTEPQKGDAKYLTSPNMPKNRVLYNLDTALLHPIVVIAEGVFDVWRIGDAGVCVFGHTLSPMQKQQLKTVYGTDGGCLLAFDPDAWDETIRLHAELRDERIFPLGTAVVRLPAGKDPDKCTRDELQAALDEAASYLRAPEEPTILKLDDMLQGLEELDDDN